jgi:hypothetical protein
MSLVAEMIPMTGNGCSWKPPPSSRATMNSALLTARRQHKVVPATGEHHDGDHHQGDRDGHEHDALGVH